MPGGEDDSSRIEDDPPRIEDDPAPVLRTFPTTPRPFLLFNPPRPRTGVDCRDTHIHGRKRKHITYYT